MKSIQIRTNIIEIPFEKDGETLFTLEFDRTDKNKKALENSFKELKEKLDILEAKGNERVTLDEAVSFVKETADRLLGEGAFDKMYEVNPSYDIVALYLYQIMIGLKEEFEAEDLKAVQSKYLS